MIVKLTQHPPRSYSRITPQLSHPQHPYSQVPTYLPPSHHTPTIDPLTQLHLEILSSILTHVFTKTYSLSHLPPIPASIIHIILLCNPRSPFPKPQQTTNSLGIFRTSSSLSKIALHNFYSTRLFNLDPFLPRRPSHTRTIPAPGGSPPKRLFHNLRPDLRKT